LPAAVVRRSPVLSIMSGWSLMMSGDLDAVESRLDDADTALAAAGQDPTLAAAWPDTDELRAAPATVSVFRAALAQARGDVEGTIRSARRAMSLARPDDHLVRGSGAGYLGLAAWAAGHVQEALSTFSEAARSLHSAGNLVDELDTRSCSRTCGSPPADPAALGFFASRFCAPQPGAVSRTRGSPPTCTSA
jgi:LuxR family transcriptional regulator, maltose regulon positive regulatory protein